ncbi:MAG: hypothetical protein U9O95_04810, partial [Candidatus Marinimicrobia bacterium]|nr:hypothetical protein [Candidatus Neomarinimicrobiota bacterium]
MKKLILVLAILFVSSGLAKAPEGFFSKSTNLSSSLGNRTLSNISNWSCWVYSNGKSAHNPDGSSGGIYPRSTAGTIYQDGFMWGGKFDTDDDGIGDHIRIGGANYNIGTVPGRVITGGDYEDGTFEVADPGDPSARLYRIRGDYQSLSHEDLIQDAAELNMIDPSSVTESMTQEIIDQYELDWEEWPGEHGAPFDDKDDDGIYTCGIDEPGYAHADQVIWFIVNDYDEIATTGMMGSPPIGLELQITIWAYDQEQVRIGQSIFKSYKLINRSNSIVTDMYFSQWSDPDIGYYGNDYCGCDTVLNLAYAYNGQATDRDYNEFDMAPPAAGYVLLQGPLVESIGDIAFIDLKPKTGYKNLSMSSFSIFPPYAAISDPDLSDPSWSLIYYNLIRGYNRTYNVDNPTPWYIGNDVTNPPTFFPLAGDPVTGAGDIDGENNWFTPGDRRIMVNTGPFDFAPGDTQEVVLALIGGVGDDNISSITELKTNSRVIRQLYNGQFENVPRAPKIPNVTVRPFERSVVLEWGSDEERTAEIEDFVVSGYEFEGYNVYQLPYGTAGKDESVRIATFDVINGIKVINDTRILEEFENEPADVPVAFGDDTGIQRYLMIDWDYINEKPLYEGQTYYYAVMAYNQNISDDRLAAKMYESRFIAYVITLQEELPGNKLNVEVGERNIPVQHTAGNSSGEVILKIIDPFAVTGEDYTIDFEYKQDSSDVLFNVKDQYDVILSEKNPIVRDTSVYTASPIIDGVEILIMGPPHGIAEVVQPDAHGSSNIIDNNLWHSLQAAGDGSQPWHRAAGAPWFYMDSRSGELNGEFADNVPDRFQTWGSSDFEIVFGDSSVAWSYINDNVLTEKVPFAIYKYDPDGTVQRQFVAIYEDQVVGTEGTWDQGIASAYTSTSGYEEIYCYGKTGGEYQVADETAYIAANDIYSAPSSTGWG